MRMALLDKHKFVPEHSQVSVCNITVSIICNISQIFNIT